jgi:DNA sulfur modification protein DndD
MIFTELVLQNFGPYSGKTTLNLQPESGDNQRSIILFGGMNGGGKTTLMDAIRLALYGSRAQCSSRNNLSYSDFLRQCINNQTSSLDQTRIELAFEQVVDYQYVQFRIVRQWNKYLNKEGKDTLGIQRENWPDESLANTWDEYVETILPLGISNLFLFDGEQVKELAEQDNPPAAVIEAIRSLLGLELAEKLAIDLDILVSRKRKALANSSQLATLEEIEARLKQYQHQVDTYLEKLASLQDNLKVAQDKLDYALDRFKIEGGKIAAQKSQLENRTQDLSKSAEIQREELRKLAASTLPLALITPLLEQALQQGEREIKAYEAQVTQGVILERDKRLLDYLDTLKIAPHYQEKIQDFLQQENQVFQQDYPTPWLELDEEGLKYLQRVLEHQLPQELHLATQQTERLKQILLDIDNLERELATAAAPEDYEKLEKGIKEAQKQVIVAQTAYNEQNRLYKEALKAIEKTKKELANYSEQVIDRSNDEHLIKSSARVQETLKLFKERLTLKKLNKLEEEVTECFRYLLHKTDLVHRVVIDTQNFSLSLFDAQGQSLPKHRLSAGEKQLLAIAFLWGLARVSGRHLPIAIDTPLGRLDSSHRNNLVERYFPTASHQVILLSTDTEIGEKEVQQLREQDAIARQYLLKYNSAQRQTSILENQYFF